MEDGIVFNGPIIVDKHNFIDFFPKEGQIGEIYDTSQSLGGIMNIMLDLHKLDFKVPISINSVVGIGQDGAFVKEEFEKKLPDVNCSGFKYEGKNAFTLVLNSASTKQRTFFSFTGNFDNFDASYIDWENQKGKYFLLEYLFLGKKLNLNHQKYGTYAGEILYKAKKQGFITAVDMASHYTPNAIQIAESALKHTDICAINEIEAETATGIKITDENGILENKAGEALFKMKEMGVSTWAIIHSPSENYGLDCQSGKLYKVPSLKLPKSFIVGTVGAGDAFFSGVLYGAYQKFDIIKAIQLGTATAACSLSKNNGTDGIKPLKETWKVFEKYKEEVTFKQLN